MMLWMLSDCQRVTQEPRVSRVSFPRFVCFSMFQHLEVGI